MFALRTITYRNRSTTIIYDISKTCRKWRIPENMLCRFILDWFDGDLAKSREDELVIHGVVDDYDLDACLETFFTLPYSSI